MNRSRAALLVLLLALAFLTVKGVLMWTRPAYDPARQIALMEEARGFALGRRIAADLPEGGRAVLLEPEPAGEAGKATSANLLRGLQAGAGGRLQFVLHAVPLTRDPQLPAFLQERVAGNAHLNGRADALAANPGAVALVARIDPAVDLPPPPPGAPPPPLYVLGSDEPPAWEKLLASGFVKAVQIDRREGYADGATPDGVEAAAARYYGVIPPR
ncbi:MAG: hypothetical protein U1F77_08070 [Kiritimatiellia bacterium]